jgi:hypothetical protein
MIHFDGETPQLIKTGQMIHVRMREDRRVDLADVFTQALRAEIRPRVHHPGHLRRAEVNRAAQPLVLRIRTPAHRTVTAYHRDADRSAGAEEGELHLHGVSMWNPAGLATICDRGNGSAAPCLKTPRFAT